jgi:hypothetical protein
MSVNVFHSRAENLPLAHLGAIAGDSRLLGLWKKYLFMAFLDVHDRIINGSGSYSGGRNTLKREIREVLLTASTSPSHLDVCPRCTRPLQYVETTFWLYGDEESYRVSLPVCSCTASTPGHRRDGLE